MISTCPYCASLQQAFPGQNYCSRHHRVKSESFRNNAFYINSPQLHSGQHQSRWTVRAVLHGYQSYQSQGRRQLLHEGNLLILPEGEYYQSEIQEERNVEAVIVAFQSTFIRQATYALQSSDRQLIDAPFDESDSPPFWGNAYARTAKINQLLKAFKIGILREFQDELWYTEKYTGLWSALLDLHGLLRQQADHLCAKKASTREELLRRLQIGRDYLEAQLAQPLNLGQLSQEAQLSPYHFLRLFKAAYGQTPFQYLRQARMRRAVYLLEHSSLSIATVAEAVGYTDQSAFTRAFKAHTKQAPLALRAAKRRK